MLIYPAQMNVYGGGISPQISYKYDKNSSSWQKHYNIYDYLGTLQQTYKSNGSNVVPTSMQTHKPFGGDNWSNNNLSENESTLLNWIGKEKDNESKLGDHGVRKYEYETGRFISIEPEWEKYFGWTPYVYSKNSPVMFIDGNGFRESLADFYMEQDVKDYLAGKITREQYWENAEARAMGAFTGLSIISPVDELAALGLAFKSLGTTLKTSKVTKIIITKLDNAVDWFKSLVKSSDEIYDAEKMAEKTVGALTRTAKNTKLLDGKYLKKNGIDAHDLKERFVGKKRVSKFDIYRDTDTGELIIMLKGGKGEPIFTGEFIF